jgi:hypothetical protein
MFIYFREGWRKIKEDQAKAYKGSWLRPTLDQAVILNSDNPKESESQEETPQAPRKIKELHISKTLKAEIAAFQGQLRKLESCLGEGIDKTGDLLDQGQKRPPDKPLPDKPPPGGALEQTVSSDTVSMIWDIDSAINK